MSKGKLVGIPPRKFQVDYSKIDVNTYYARDKALTVFWNTLSMFFPEGEQFFVESVRKYRDMADSEQLQNEISGFIGQEAFHTHAHKAFNDLLTKEGYPIKGTDAIIKNALTLIRKEYPEIALYATAVLEHYTATLGMQLLDDLEHSDSIIGEARKMWLHHAVEETEHRCVSYDLLEKVSSNFEIKRKLAFVPVSAVFFIAVGLSYADNMRRQKASVSELKSIPKLSKLLLRNTPRIVDWFRTGFHPRDHISHNIENVKKELNIA